MFFPLIPLAGVALTALGLYGLAWYAFLSKDDKAKADELAARYARSLFHTGLAQLTRRQLNDVYTVVKCEHFDRGA